jgi:histidine ammonia-lyase
MTVIIDAAADISLASLESVAIDGGRARFSDRALRHMAWAHEAFQRYVDARRDTFIYGVTSGWGPDGKTRYSPEEVRARRQRGSPWLQLSFGGGLLPEYVSRASVFASLGLLASGNSAIHPDQAREVAGLLDGPLPRLPRRGLVAAGELMPNFVLRQMDSFGQGYSAGAGNGSQTSNAMAGLTAIFARRRLDLAEHVLALSAEAVNAPLDAYDPALKDLWRDPFAADALDALAALIAGGSPDRRPYDAPASFQILPRVLGQARRAVSALEEVASISLREVASNPMYLLPDGDDVLGKAISTGGYHNATAAAAIDAVAATWADIAALAHRHAVKLHKGEVSLLPDRLLPEGTDYTTGYSTTYLEYVPNQALEEMRRLAQPTLLDAAEIAASEQDDIAITAPVAFVAERDVAERFDEILAVLAVVCSQALHVTRRPAPPALQPLLSFTRGIVAPIESRRMIGVECQELADAFAGAVEKPGTGVPWRASRTGSENGTPPRAEGDVCL